MMVTEPTRWRCCDAGMRAAPGPCPWHGDPMLNEAVLRAEKAEADVERLEYTLRMIAGKTHAPHLTPQEIAQAALNA
jgi:hypothetical protein